MQLKTKSKRKQAQILVQISIYQKKINTLVKTLQGQIKMRVKTKSQKKQAQVLYWFRFQYTKKKMNTKIIIKSRHSKKSEKGQQVQ